MKNIFKFGALIAVSALFAFSCQKSEIAFEKEQSSEKAVRTITLNFPSDPESKMSMAEDGKTAWQAGDEILIHGAKVGQSGETYYSRVITLKASDIHDEGKTATFTLEEINADAGWGRSGYKATMFAAYPASALVDIENGAWWYYSSAWNQTNTLLLAGTNDTSVNDGNTFTFTQLTGVLSFVVSGEFDSYVISGNGGTEVVGYDVFAVRVDTQNSFGDKNKIPYNGGSGGLGFSGEKTSITAPVVADGSTVNHIYFPGGVNFANGFTIKFLKGGVEQKRVSTSTAKNIARGKYLKLGDITSHLFVYTPPATHNSSIDMTGATDLSASASANCYVVEGIEANKDKVYKFKAYKGNTDIGVGVIESVEVLWETWNNSESVTEHSVIAAVDFDKQAENDYYEICFKMPTAIRPGNAVLAARNTLGKILWSWHIWVPASAVTSSTYGLEGQTWMDRNLGALTVTEASEEADASPSSFGLLYSWGRKDPFPGLASFDGSSPITTTTTFDYHGALMSVADSYESPTVFVQTSADANWPWCTDADKSGLWATSKTINDPCPPGYVVPQFKDGEGLWTGKNATGFTINATHKWYKMGTDPYIVFPIVGFLDACQSTTPYIRERGARTLIWSSTLSDSGGLAKTLRVNSDGSSKNESERICRGNSIRCVAIPAAE